MLPSLVHAGGLLAGPGLQDVVRLEARLLFVSSFIHLAGTLPRREEPPARRSHLAATLAAVPPGGRVMLKPASSRWHPSIRPKSPFFQLCELGSAVGDACGQSRKRRHPRVGSRPLC